MCRPLLVALIAAVAVALAAPPASVAQQDANVERGFAAEKIYQFGNLDQVNLFNGNLSLTIPIGSIYPVAGSLSYGLTLVYNSKIWDLYSGPEVPNGPLVTFAELTPHDNAGIGWRLTLGQLVPSADPNNVSGLAYVGPDGSEHGFTHPNLHAGEPTVANTWYTRDGSYLRLKKPSATVYEVESGDGTIRKFVVSGSPTSPYRLEQIRDRFGNDLTITHFTGPVRWKLDDGHRVHWVYFKTVANREVVDRVEQASFGGTTATYMFNYSSSSIQEHCGDLHSKTPANRSVPLLTSVSLPANAGSYRMDGPGDYYTGCRDGGTTIVDLPGVLHRLELPTLGSIEWTYQTHSYPARGIFTPGEPSLEVVETLGVETKRVLDAAGSCVTLGGVGCQWTYTAGQSGSIPTLERSMRVTHPTGDETVYHFSLITALSTSAWTGWEYGLPFKKSATSGAGYFLSQEIFDGTAAGGNKKRSIYIGYERDVLPGSTNSPSTWYNTNRRVVREKTVYHDDGNREATVVSSEFDGLGHYRKRVTGGSFDAGNVRTDFTDFNPGQGIFSVNQATNVQAGGYTPWGGNSPWVLGNSTETWSQEGGSTVKTQTCYQGQTGALGWTRSFKNHSGAQGVDVLTVLTRDGQGNVTREEHYGADAGGLPATNQNGSCTLSGLPAAGYRIDHGYQSGSRRSSQYIRANGTAMPFLSLNLAIDASTGRPANSTDLSGITTSFEYDALARLTWSKPASGHDAWTEYSYFKATSASSLARVAIRRRANGSKTGAVRDEAEIGFDALGRVSQDRKRLPGGVWTTVATRYNAMGWVFDVSERMSGTPDKSTKRLDYDPFGRPRTIRPPDSVSPGFAHDVTLSYAGARTVTREVAVGTGAFSGGSVTETAQAVTEVYDRQGRLFKVREPSGAGGTVIDTIYGYDAAGRLTSVSTTAGGTTQSRVFNYDGRGFLTSEQHPEKGTGGNGTVTYSAYDARGHATRRLEGAAGGLFDVTFAYDRAERLTLMRETGGAQRPLKEYTYDSGGGTWGNGKRVTAVRYNHVIPPWNTVEVTVPVTETYTYNGRGGRPSARSTAAATGQSFSQSWVYNDLGQVSSLVYPTCDTSVPACSSPAVAPARTITPTYAEGLLTAIPGYAASISYHPNGTLNQVVHANGVTWTQGLDPDSMARPGSLTATRGAATLWTTGDYRYDGAGNVTVIGPNDSGQSDFFVYDPVSRLVQSTTYAPRPTPGTGYQPYRQNYSFDPFGNLTQIDTQVGMGSWQTRTIATVASTNRISGLAYDAAGNQLAWGTFGYGWDSTSRMRYMDGGGLDEIYLYTAGDERIWTYDAVPEPDQETFTLRDLDGKVLRTYRSAGGPAGTWSWLGDHVYRNGALLATVRSAPEGTRHLHPDHLGTPRLITDSAGNQVAYHAYYPFGEEATDPTQDGEPMKFTGHERDLNLAGQTDDLDYMHARYCSPMTGRFLGVDPLGGLHSRPQTWNLYAYVGGNPLIWIDPYGLRGESPSDPWTDEITVCEDASTGKPCLRPIPELSDLEAEYQRFLRDFDSYRDSSPGRVQAALDWLNGKYERRFDQMAIEGHHTAAFIDYFALEMLFPETTGQLAADVAMTFLPPLRAGKGLSRNFDWIIKKLGIQPHQARQAIHDAKKHAGRRGDDDMLFDPDTGDIIEPETGEIIGNLWGE